MSEEKRVRRTPEQIAADLDVQIEKLKDSILELENKKAASVTEFDNKIAAVKEKIAKLEAKKKDVLTPKKRKPRKSKADQIKLLVRQAQKSGMKLDEIADKLLVMVACGGAGGEQPLDIEQKDLTILLRHNADVQNSTRGGGVRLAKKISGTAFGQDIAMPPEILLYHKGRAGQHKAHDLGGIPGAENI